MKMFKRRLSWVASHGFLIAALWATLHYDIPGLGRALILLIWALTALLWVSAFILVACAIGCPKEIKQDTRDKLAQRTFPAWFGLLFDLGMMVWLAWINWPFTGLVWLSTQIPEWMIYSIVPEALKRREKREKEESGETEESESFAN